MNLAHLYPKPGEYVDEWWSRVIEWAKTLTVELGPGMRSSQGLNGLRVMVSDSSPVRTPFRVGLTGRRARISTGYLDASVPYILSGDGETAVRLDGTGADGLTPDPLGLPVLDLSDAEPGPDGRSAIVLRLTLDERGIPLDDEETPEALQILHLSDFSPAAKRALLTDENQAIQELAILYWSNNEPTRVGQVVRHNLVASYATETQTAFFSAV
jgi:hypothetical protein